MGGKSGGSSQPSTQTVTQNTTAEPPAILKPYLEDIYAKAQGAYGNTSQDPYSGTLIAGPTTQQQQAVSQQEGVANQLTGAGFGQNALQLAQDTAGGNYLHPGSNPYLQQSIEAAIRPVTEAYTENILPGLASSAAMGGAYGSSADLAQREIAGRSFTREALDAANRVANQNYQNERNIQLQSPAMLSGAAQNLLLPSNILGSAGEALQGYEQLGAEEAYQKYQLEQLAPWLGLPEYASILGTGTFPGGTSTSTGTLMQASGGPSRFGGALQGALGGAGLGAGLAGSLALGPAWPFAAGGAALGALAGLF